MKQNNSRQHNSEDFVDTRNGRIFAAKAKSCHFCESDLIPEYKNPDSLKQFISDCGGRILPSRISNVCAKHQRNLATAVKRARILGLLPFVLVKQ